MKTWKLTNPVRVDVLHELRPTENAVFFVNEEEDARRWLNVQLSIGKFTPASTEECMQDWPREAIRMLRAELDKIENLLNEEQTTDETSIH